MRKTHHYQEEIKEWIAKAEGDLIAAEAILTAKAPGWAAGFHCQQAVEKILKALLLYSANSYPKEHDLTKLYQLANKTGSDITLVKKEIFVLTDYYVGSRYPGIKQSEITLKQAKQAYNNARRVFDFVAELIDF
ncbi:MAG: HEPN domain-containing protein [Candidatus Berkelbacteria bacterium Licking1014_7]|uniref:HEPN domain-containing protein n=1 Tax=Candidatus Berkelbacteria bacterium Licking1014_7 TaxID=2017147 RepID=A0A554LKU3_9BACT|nr:MAG: HEPN domain-containing protein [Candidatus Berkelbacteria bacterium Licking1014_7]